MRSGAVSREEILASSRAILREKGWSALNMRGMAAACGVAVGSLYTCFPSKAELVMATVESIWQEVFRLPSDFGPEEPFCACVSWLYQSMRRGNQTYPGLLALHAMGFTTESKPEGRRMMERVQTKLRTDLCRVLAQDRQVRADVFDVRLTREGFVELVFSMLVSALMRGEEDCTPHLEMLRRVLY